ncbi:MAG: DUF2027 domain-containing protein [Bacteroidales bacterium]|jgi:hypothetical protein|nr:DUF2027 domain-containing protein [Bacteroidales bacterium]
MEINIGDRVRFLNDVGEAVVVKILSKQMVMVCDDDGFEYQVVAKELIVIKKAEKKINIISQVENNIKVEEAIKEKFYKKNNITNIFLAFVKDEVKNSLKLFLINDSNYTFFYNIILKENLKYKKLDSDKLEENTKIEISELSIEQINHSDEIIVQLQFCDHPTDIYRSQIEKNIKIVPLNFWQDHRYVDNDFIDEKAYLFDIERENFKYQEKNVLGFEKVKEILREEAEEDKSKRFAPRKKKEVLEVDLHITSLVESIVGLSNAEIVEIQLKEFNKAVTEAVMNKNIEKLILIHGIGAGTLKNLIREALTNVYHLKFEDASYREYGFGATMVLIN